MKTFLRKKTICQVRIFSLLVIITALVYGSSIAQDTCTMFPSTVTPNLAPGYCVASPTIALTGSPAGGVFGGPGISGNIFNAAIAGVGTHTISYTYMGYGIDTSFAFAPVAGPGTGVGLSDDEVGGPFPIGFSFNFFGNVYTYFFISSNGFITFNPDFNDGCCSGDVLPSPGTPSNLIAFAWEDLYPPGAGSVEYFTTGTAPNRKLIVNFNGIPWCCDGIPRVTTQLILYESTNVIEIHTTSTESSGSMTMGIENIDGSFAHVVPGRNSSMWVKGAEMVRFTPNSCPFAGSQTTTITSSPPVIGVSDICLDYDTVYATGTYRDTVYISNSGCDTLFLTNVVISGDNEFVIDSFSPFILAGDIGGVAVNFIAPVAGTYSATLTIQNNAADTAVCLLGSADPAPIIGVVPAFFNETINACNDSITQSLTVSNSGSGPLTYSINLSASVADTILKDGFESGGFISWNSGSGAYTRTVTTANPASGLYSFSLIGGNFNYYDGVSHTFSSSSPANYVSYRFMSPIGSWGWNCGVVVGNSSDITVNDGIADSWIDNSTMTVYLWTPTNGTISIPVIQGQWYQIEYRNINYTTKQFDYYVNGNLIAANLTFWNTNITSIDVVHLMGWDPGHTSNYDDILIGSDASIWLIPSPLTGTVMPAGSSNINVKFKSSNVTNGIYYANILVNSNDPLAPVVTVPCTLAVNGVSNIYIPVVACSKFDTIMVGGADQDTFPIQNLGCDTLFISSVTSSVPDFTIDYFPPYILPYSTVNLLVSFAPDLPSGDKTATISVFNSDADTAFCVDGHALPAPTIGINPLSFNVTIPTCNDSVTQTLTIDNTGAANLQVNLVPGATNLGPIFKYGYICNAGTNNVSVINSETNAIVTTVPVGSYPWRAAIRPDAKFVYVCNRNSSNISVINTASNTVVTTIPLGGNPGGIGFTKDSKFAFVADRSNNNVKKIDCATNTIIATINDPNFDDPQDIAVTPDGARVFVCTQNTGITVIDFATNTVIGNIPGGNGAHSLIFTPDGSKAYISEPWNDRVRVVNTSSISTITTISGFDDPHGLDITRDGNFVFVLDKWNSQIDVISTSSNTIVNTISDARLNNGWDLIISHNEDYIYASNPFPSNSNEDVMIYSLPTLASLGTRSTGSGTRGLATIKDVYASFVNASPSMDTIVPAGSTNISIEFNGLGLISGTYISDLSVYSNDPVNPLIQVPCTLNITAPPDFTFLGLSDTIPALCLDMDSIMAFTASTDTIFVANTGCDSLFLDSISFTDPVFSMDTSGFPMAPGDTSGIIVRFYPIAQGTFSGTMNIYTNDLDTSICLFGKAFAQPLIGVTPSSFTVTVNCADTIQDTIFISNTGGSVLNYTVSENSYDSTRTINFSTSGQLNNFVHTSLSVNDSLYLTVTLNGDFDGGSEYAELYIDGTYIGIIPDNNLLNTDMTFDYAFGGPQVLAWLSDGQVTVTIDNTSSVGSSGYHRLRVFLPGRSWLSETPISGSVPIGSTDTVYVEFNSSNLLVGQYTGTIFINSNDPLSSTIQVLSTLIVNGGPDFKLAALADTIAPLCLYLDSIMEFTTSTDSILLTNTGCDTLWVDSLIFSPAEFSLVSNPPYIIPGDTGSVVIRFSPVSAGTYSGSVNIYTNDLDTVICLKGYGYDRSIISFNPDTIFKTINCAGAVTDTVTIYNTGLSDLIYSTFSLDTGRSALFDGVNDYMSTALNIDQGATSPGLTLEAWVYPTSNSTGNHAVISTDNGGSDWSILRNAGTWYVFTGSTSINTGFTVDLNQWQHLAAVFIPGTGVRFYKNGVLFSTASIGLDASDDNVWVGSNSGGGEYFAGRIDEARVWDIQRSQAAIQSTMNKRLLGNENGLRAYWNYDNGTASDGSGNGFNGTFFQATVSLPSAPVTPAWLSYINVISDTIPAGDSSKVGFAINSAGLVIGQYTSGVVFVSNDPQNSPDTVMLVMDIVGAADFQLAALADTIAPLCLYLDSIMALTISTDTIYVTNIGCDTLWLDSLIFSASAFTADTFTSYLEPGDTGVVVVLFSPDSAGSFTGTLNVYTNDLDTAFCLKGIAFPQPIISHAPDTISVSLTCCDSVDIPLTIYNTGGSNLIWNIVTNTDFYDDVESGAGNWASTGLWHLENTQSSSPVTSWTYNTGSPNYNFATGTNSGSLTSEEIDLTNVLPSASVTLTFNCYYQTEGGTTYDQRWIQISSNGGPFTNFIQLSGETMNSWHLHSFDISSYIGSKIKIRYFFNSVDGISNTGWGWSVDNIAVAGGLENCNSFLCMSPTADTTIAGDSSIVNVSLNSCGLLTGTYNANLYIFSNDPLKSIDTIHVILDVNGTADFQLLGLGDTIAPLCLDLDSIMEFTTSTDTIYFRNNGCDTLVIDSINISPLEFSLDTSTSPILMGDSGFIVVRFSPLSSGSYNGTLNLYSNELDTVFCLYGKSYPMPVQCHNPDSFNLNFNICIDSIVDSISVCNTGGSDLYWNLSATGGKSVSLNGTNSYINTGAWSAGSKWTIEAWVRPSALPAGRHTIAGGMNACLDWGIVMENGIFGVGIRPGACSQTISSGVPAIVGTWYHVVGTNDGLTAKIYVNGILQNTGAVDPNYIGYTGNTWIGGEACCGNYFPGLVDEVRIWNISRTQAQISSTMNTLLSGSESGLVGYWNFDNGTANDLSSGGHNGSFINGASAVTPNCPVPSIIPGWVTFNPISDTTAVAATKTSSLIFTKAGLAPGVYNYSLYLNSNDPLNSWDTIPVTLTVDSIPTAAPAVNDTFVCSGNPTPPLIAMGGAGDTIKWYDDGALTNLVYTGNPFVSTQTVVGTYTYYVTATDSVNGCTSLSDTATLTINAPPSAPTATSNSPACTGQNLSLTASALGGATYSWNGPNGFTSTTQNPVITPVTTSDAGTYSVTVTVSGCPASAAGTTTVVVNQTPVSPTALSNSPICAGNDLSLTASTVGSSTYTWNGPNSFTSTDQNPIITSSTTAASGNYSVTATENGCTSPAGTFSVTVNAIPAAPIAGYNTPACTGQILSLTANTIFGAAYSWNGPNGFTSSFQNPTIGSATTAESGTYSVTATVSGCTGAAGTVSVSINITPSAPAASSNSPVCSGTTLSLSATTGGSPTYSWVGPNSYVSGSQNPTIGIVSTLANGTYSVIATENGCVGPEGTVSVTVYQTPVAPIAGSNSAICVGQDLSLTASTVGGSTYDWTGPNSFTSTLQNPVIIGAGLADAGTYSVSATENGCAGSEGTVNAIVNSPPASPLAGSDSPVCSGQNLNLTATATGAMYSWNGPNGFTSASQNPVISSVSTVASGTYSVVAINAGCPPSSAGTTVATVYQTPSAPVASSNTPVCLGDNISLSAVTSGSPAYSWTGPNSFTSSLQNPVIASAATADAGTYSVAATENGCTGPAGTTILIVNTPPSVPVAGNNSPVCSGQTLSLTASVSGTTYLWNGPNGYTSMAQNPTIGSVTTGASGTYSVTANVPGCPTSAEGTTSVTINQTPSPPTAGSNAPICAGTDLSLTATLTGSPTYLWSGPGSFTSTLQNPVIVAAATSASGNYSVTATANSCTGPVGIVGVTVNPPPATPLAGSNSPVCSGQNLSLTASNISGATYSWSGPNGFTSTVQNPIISPASTLGSGTYSVTVTVPGCPTSAAGTTTVTVNQSPSVPTAGSNSPICTGSDLSLTATTSGSPAYSWNGPGSFTSTLQDPVIVAAATSASGNYSVTATEFGCLSPVGVLSVTVNPIPSVPAAGSNSAVCVGSDLSLTASASGSPVYSWIGPNGFTSSLQNPVIIAVGTPDAGTYSVTTIENGCADSAGTTAVIVNDPPSVPVAGNNSSICSGQDLNLTASATGATYSWNGPNGYTSTTQNPVVISVSTSEAGTYSVTATVPGCPASAAGTTTVIINQTPSAPAVGSNSPICAGTDLSLTATTNGSPTFSWNGPGSFTSGLQTPVIAAAATSASGTYSVTATEFGCTGTAGTGSVTVNPIPAAPAAGSNSPVCEGSILSLTASTVGGATYNWNGPNGFSSASQNPTIGNVNGIASGNYSVTATESGCTGFTGTVSVTVTPLPAAPVSTPQTDTACFGAPNPAFSVAGPNIEWWNNGATTILEFNGSPFTPTVTATGTYSYYVTQTAAGCKGSSDTVVFVIASTPALAVNDTTVLFGSPVVILSAGGTNVQWYDASLILAGTGNSYNTGQTAVGTYTYYVTQTLNGCESASDTVILTIVPGAPLGVNDTVCFGQTVPDLTATGTNLQWWSDPALTLLAGTGSPFTTGQSAIGTYTYYVTQTMNFVQSPSDTVFLVINFLPVPPVASNDNACVGGIIPDLTATGTTIQWYDSSSSFVFSGSPFPTNQTAVGTYTYAVTQTDAASGCESPADTVILVINALPSIPVAGSDTIICFGNPIPDLTATGTNINWYDGSGSSVGSGSPFASGVTAPGTYTFIATQTNTVTTCESSGDTVLLTINAAASPVAPDVAICFGAPVPPLVATGTTIQWYDNTMAPIFSGDTLVHGQTAVGTYTYYVTQTNTVTACSSVPDTVLLFISNQPTAAPVISDDTACGGTSIPALVATTGSIINWYSDAALTNLLFSGNPYSTGLTTPGTYTFFAADSTPGCPQGPSDTVTFVILPQPSAISVNDTSACVGVIIPDLVASGTNITWYDDVMTIVSTNDTFASGQTVAGTYTYYVTQSDTVTGCASPPDTIMLTIYGLPSIPISLDTAVCASAIIPDLTTSGTNIQWYDTAWTFMFAGNTYATGQTVAGTYTHYVTQKDLLTGCESVPDTSVLAILTAPLVPVANDVAICVGNPVPPLMSSGFNPHWYSDAAFTNLVNTGNLYNTGQTAAGIYTYWVKDSLSGCISSSADSVSLIIDPAPVKPLANDTLFCYGDTAVITSTGVNPYWYSDATLINLVGTGSPFYTGIIAVGTYLLYVTDYAAGCGNSVSDTALITINPNPLVTANTYSITIIEGNSTMLTAYNAVSYLWTPGGQTSQSIVVSPTITTSYTVTGTNQYGCFSSVTIVVYVSPLGISFVNEPVQNVNIYPNPAVGSFTLEFSTTIETPVDIYMFNTLGKKVRVIQNEAAQGRGLTKHKYLIDTSTFTEGIYNIEIVTQNGSVNRRVVLFR